MQKTTNNKNDFQKLEFEELKIFKNYMPWNNYTVIIEMMNLDNKGYFLELFKYKYKFDFLTS